jgi:heme exporter protein C
MLKLLHKLGSPPYFYALAQRLLPWLLITALCLLILGLITGLAIAPADYQQGDGFRIMYVHVPAALMSLTVYMLMAFCGAVSLIWKTKITDVIAFVSAPIGASFTFIALFTGAVWGKPMWGTWWVWDARLTSELILLFLYLGYMALYAATDDRGTAARAGAILLLVGVVDIPIIHFSVDWWNTLHQGASLSLLTKPTIAGSMLYPLLIMMAAFFTFYLAVMLLRASNEVLVREHRSQWVKKYIKRELEREQQC